MWALSSSLPCPLLPVSLLEDQKSFRRAGCGSCSCKYYFHLVSEVQLAHSLALVQLERVDELKKWQNYAHSVSNTIFSPYYLSPTQTCKHGCNHKCYNRQHESLRWHWWNYFNLMSAMLSCWLVIHVSLWKLLKTKHNILLCPEAKALDMPEVQVALCFLRSNIHICR